MMEYDVKNGEYVIEDHTVKYGEIELKELAEQPANIPVFKKPNPPIKYIDKKPDRERIFSLYIPLTKTPAHPGALFNDYCVKQENVTKVAKSLAISRQSLSNFINCKNNLTPEMALRIAIYTGTSPFFWLQMQNEYDIYLAEDKIKRVNY